MRFASSNGLVVIAEMFMFEGKMYPVARLSKPFACSRVAGHAFHGIVVKRHKLDPDLADVLPLSDTPNIYAERVN